MRPRSIIHFEQRSLMSLAIGLLMALFSWAESVAPARAGGFGPGFVVFVQAFSLGLPLLLILLVSRRASSVAKWLLILSLVGGLALMLGNAEELFAGGPRFIVQIVQMLLQAVAIALLFTEEARRWFRDGPRRNA